MTPPFVPDPALVAQVEAAVIARDGRQHGSEITFRCPAHDDEHPSASFNTEKYGWVCRVCGAKGGVRDLAKRLGIELPIEGRRDDGLTLAALAAAKGLSVEFLAACGVADGWRGPKRRRCVDIPHVDASGQVRAVQKRLSLHAEPRFLWRKGDRAIAYGLNRLPSPGQPIVIVEGASDCWTLWLHGIGALGIPGVAHWHSEYAALVKGRDVFVWQEPRSGATLVNSVGADLPEARVILAPDDAKDPSVLYMLTPDAFVERMRALMAEARPARERLDAERQAISNAAFATARPLLEAPDLLARIERSIVKLGYAGDPTPALLVYWALTSRCLGRPMNLAIVAASAAGKNRAIDAARPLFPDDAYVLLKAGSARALVYGDHDYSHRTVIVAEADSIPADGPAASAVRALAADNSMEYDVVEKDKETGHFTVRQIVKPGPTGLITTYTRQLDEQMSTRLLTISIVDTPDQTRAVLHAHAATVNGEYAEVDVEPFVAAQLWLAIAGVKEIAVPFADALAERVPVALVRMRRDFRQLLTTIEASAFLHQRQRDRDERGRVVATLADYAIARRLLLDTFTAAATGGLSADVVETARAVRDLCSDAPEGVRVMDVGKRLGLHTATAWRRIQKAIRAHMVVNRETKRRQPAILVPGENEPDSLDVLPTPDVLGTAIDLPRKAENAQTEAEASNTSAARVRLHTVFTPPQTGVQTATAEPARADREPIARLHHHRGGEIDYSRPETWPDDYQRWYADTVALAVESRNVGHAEAEKIALADLIPLIREIEIEKQIAALPD